MPTVAAFRNRRKFYQDLLRAAPGLSVDADSLSLMLSAFAISGEEVENLRTLLISCASVTVDDYPQPLNQSTLLALIAAVAKSTTFPVESVWQNATALACMLRVLSLELVAGYENRREQLAPFCVTVAKLLLGLLPRILRRSLAIDDHPSRSVYFEALFALYHCYVTQGGVAEYLVSLTALEAQGPVFSSVMELISSVSAFETGASSDRVLLHSAGVQGASLSPFVTEFLTNHRHVRCNLDFRDRLNKALERSSVSSSVLNSVMQAIKNPGSGPFAGKPDIVHPSDSCSGFDRSHAYTLRAFSQEGFHTAANDSKDLSPSSLCPVLNAGVAVSLGHAVSDEPSSIADLCGTLFRQLITISRWAKVRDSSSRAVDEDSDSARYTYYHLVAYLSTGLLQMMPLTHLTLHGSSAEDSFDNDGCLVLLKYVNEANDSSGTSDPGELKAVSDSLVSGLRMSTYVRCLALLLSVCRESTELAEKYIVGYQTHLALAIFLQEFDGPKDPNASARSGTNMQVESSTNLSIYALQVYQLLLNIESDQSMLSNVDKIRSLVFNWCGVPLFGDAFGGHLRPQRHEKPQDPRPHSERLQNALPLCNSIVRALHESTDSYISSRVSSTRLLADESEVSSLLYNF